MTCSEPSGFVSRAEQMPEPGSLARIIGHLEEGTFEESKGLPSESVISISAVLGPLRSMVKNTETGSGEMFSFPSFAENSRAYRPSSSSSPFAFF